MIRLTRHHDALPATERSVLCTCRGCRCSRSVDLRIPHFPTGRCPGCRRGQHLRNQESKDVRRWRAKDALSRATAIRVRKDELAAKEAQRGR